MNASKSYLPNTKVQNPSLLCDAATLPEYHHILTHPYLVWRLYLQMKMTKRI